MSGIQIVLLLASALLAVIAMPMMLRWPVSASATGPTAGSGVSYYVDDSNGSDSNSGISPATAWRSLSKASNVALNQGDNLLFKRGGVWSGTLHMSESGTADEPIRVSAFGEGAPPVIQGGNDCVVVSGSQIIISQLEVSDCAWAGVKFPSGSHHNRVEESLISGNVAGVYVASGATDNQVFRNMIRDNTKMSVLTPGGDDDSGAFGVLLNGDRTEVANNTISGHDAFSYDYGRDGSAVDVYSGQGNQIHHNLALDNETFSELGNSRSRDNTYAYNVVRSTLEQSFFLVTRGSGSAFGPVENTTLLNNTVVLTGQRSQGFVCHAGCNPSVLSMRNNIIQAVAKVGFADGVFDEDYNLYYGGRVQFTTGGHTIVSNPMFVDSLAGDLHISSNSPAIDSGVSSGYQTDLDGALIPCDGNGDGIIETDRGAYERGSCPEVTPSSTPTPVHSTTPHATASPTLGPSATPDATASPMPRPSPTPTGMATPTIAPSVVPVLTPSPAVTTATPKLAPPSAPTPAVLAEALPTTGGPADSRSASTALFLFGGALLILLAALCDIARGYRDSRRPPA